MKDDKKQPTIKRAVVEHTKRVNIKNTQALHLKMLKTLYEGDGADAVDGLMAAGMIISDCLVDIYLGNGKEFVKIPKEQYDLIMNRIKSCAEFTMKGLVKARNFEIVNR